jgi:hypothetical protein
VALVTMVANPSLLEKQVVEFLQRMTEQKKDFTLAMLLPSEAALFDKWNLVLSAPWIDRAGLRAVIPTITSSLQERLSKANAKKLERISVLPTTDPLVSAMTSFHIPLGEVSRIQYLPQVEDATVLVAELPATSRLDHVQHSHTRA